MSDSSRLEPPLHETKVDLTTRRHQMFPVLNETEIARIEHRVASPLIMRLASQLLDE